MSPISTILIPTSGSYTCFNISYTASCPGISGSSSFCLAPQCANLLEIHFHEDIAALHLDRIALHRLNRRHGQSLARADIKPRAVAWAGNIGPVKPAARQRCSVMRTHILDGIILSTHIKEEHGDTIEIDWLLLSWR